LFERERRAGERFPEFIDRVGMDRAVAVANAAAGEA
jgi:hypothetical protein